MAYKPLYSDSYFKDLTKKIDALIQKKAAYNYQNDPKYQANVNALNKQAQVAGLETLQKLSGSYSGSSPSSYASSAVLQQKQKYEDQRLDIVPALKKEYQATIDAQIKALKDKLSTDRALEKDRFNQYLKEQNLKLKQAKNK